MRRTVTRTCTLIVQRPNPIFHCSYICRSLYAGYGVVPLIIPILCCAARLAVYSLAIYSAELIMALFQEPSAYLSPWSVNKKKRLLGVRVQLFQYN